MPEKKTRTDEDRARHAAFVRTRRAELKRDTDFLRFCRDVKINPSAPSSLNPEFWGGFCSLYKGLDLRRVGTGCARFHPIYLGHENE